MVYDLRSFGFTGCVISEDLRDISNNLPKWGAIPQTKIRVPSVQLNEHFTKPIRDISSFISMWEESYSCAFKSTDAALLKELIIISSKISELKVIQNRKYEEERIEYQKMIESPEYQSIEKANQAQAELYRKQEQEKYQMQEQERLKHCIEALGEVQGRSFWERL
jgi:hypothetical protein